MRRLKEAQRLASHRAAHDKLRVAVVTTAEVYNEYGSGGQDVTAIRDLMKQLYDRAPAGKQMQAAAVRRRFLRLQVGPLQRQSIRAHVVERPQPVQIRPGL
ncbi:C25 family cysteine peptidase [Hymenobacter humi]|uniref:C25 family cysteine peptidase n=1 Tax=Hymenobacter humi TaxID=1411620 RepID=A0ABW2TXQ0_9BACT